MPKNNELGLTGPGVETVEIPEIEKAILRKWRQRPRCVACCTSIAKSCQPMRKGRASTARTGGTTCWKSRLKFARSRAMMTTKTELLYARPIRGNPKNSGTCGFCAAGLSPYSCPQPGAGTHTPAPGHYFLPNEATPMRVSESESDDPCSEGRFIGSLSRRWTRTRRQQSSNPCANIKSEDAKDY